LQTWISDFDSKNNGGPEANFNPQLSTLIITSLAKTPDVKHVLLNYNIDMIETKKREEDRKKGLSKVNNHIKTVYHEGAKISF